MSKLDSSIRRAAVQYVSTDELFGLREVPLRLPDRPAAKAAPGRKAQTPEAREAKAQRLRVLDEEQVRGCTRCGLAAGRTNTVFGQGHPDARLVFVGEAPGHEEDRQGLAFVGRAGQLLTRMIAAMGLAREEVFICNVLKCRPPNNRDPAADEIAACSPYLYDQLSTIEPEVIIALGAPAARTLLQTTDSIGRLRGRFHDFYLSGIAGVGEPIPLMATYHPAYLLRNPAEKAKAWSDLQAVMRRMGLVAPK